MHLGGFVRNTFNYGLLLHAYEPISLKPEMMIDMTQL